MYDNIFSMCTYFASEFESGQESKLMSVCLCYPGRGGVGVVPAYRWTGSGRKQNRYADGKWGRGRVRVRERERCWGAQVNQSNTKAITQWEHTHTLTAGAGVGWHGEGAGERERGKAEGWGHNSQVARQILTEPLSDKRARTKLHRRMRWSNIWIWNRAPFLPRSLLRDVDVDVECGVDLVNWYHPLQLQLQL